MVLCITKTNLFLTFLNCMLAWTHKWYFKLASNTARLWGCYSPWEGNLNFECRLMAGREVWERSEISSNLWAAENGERITNRQHHALLILQIPEHHLGIIIPVLLHTDIQHLHDFVIILCECFLWLIKEQSYWRALVYFISKRNGEELWYVWANNSYW